MNTSSSELSSSSSQTADQPHNGATAQSEHEQSLVQTYMDLTGATERQARAVLMFISSTIPGKTINTGTETAPQQIDKPDLLGGPGQATGKKT